MSTSKKLSPFGTAASSTPAAQAQPSTGFNFGAQSQPSTNLFLFGPTTSANSPTLKTGSVFKFGSSPTPTPAPAPTPAPVQEMASSALVDWQPNPFSDRFPHIRLDLIQSLLSSTVLMPAMPRSAVESICLSTLHVCSACKTP